MDINTVVEITNELFDGDGGRHSELIQSISDKFKQCEDMKSLLLEMKEKRPSGVYFNPWDKRIDELVGPKN